MPDSLQVRQKRKSDAALLKEADMLGLNLKPYPNKAGFKYIRKHYDAYIAEVDGKLCLQAHGQYQPAKLGRFDTAVEAALALAKHLSKVDEMRKSGISEVKSSRSLVPLPPLP